MRTPRPRKEVPLEIPPKMEGIDSWLVVGIDPSLSRTGYAIMYVHSAAAGQRLWQDVGSIKPSDAGDPIWVRGKAMALYLRETISRAYALISKPEKTGLLISMEYPTPMNDFLVALNRIIHLVFFDGDFYKQFANIRILTTNASTLRSMMGLTMRGSKNKKENILKAYEFIPRSIWPSLDTDSCDAVLLAMMGQYASSVMLGIQDIPDRFKTVLCNATQEVKGAGTRMRIITKGLLHRPEYWYSYERKPYTLLVKDAASPKSGLRREHFTI